MWFLSFAYLKSKTLLDSTVDHEEWYLSLSICYSISYLGSLFAPQLRIYSVLLHWLATHRQFLLKAIHLLEATKSLLQYEWAAWPMNQFFLALKHLMRRFVYDCLALSTRVCLWIMDILFSTLVKQGPTLHHL